VPFLKEFLSIGFSFFPKRKNKKNMAHLGLDDGLFDLSTITGKPKASPAPVGTKKRKEENKNPWTDEFKRLLLVEKEEVILKEDDKRYLPFPILHPDIHDLFVKHIEAEWRPSEVTDLEQDRKQFKASKPEEQRLLSYVLAFFSASDGIVLENLASRFMNTVQLSEARAFYSIQIKMETIHAFMYGILLTSIIDEPAERDRLLLSIRTIPSIHGKARWAQRWIQREDAPFAARLAAFAAVEGIFFSASFLSIFWFKRRGKYPATAKANEWIARDEGLHTDHACLLYRKLKYRLSDTVIHDMFSEAVDHEKTFIDDALPVPLVGLRKEEMGQYVEFITDRLLKQLGHPPLYKTANPFDWMEMIGMQGKSNMHEMPVSEYRLPIFNTEQAALLVHPL
jgi:ribonucleoside-diphosphate reductase beta chain